MLAWLAEFWPQIAGFGTILSTAPIGCWWASKHGWWEPIDTWCQGCDQIQPSTDMHFTEIGLYRCGPCVRAATPRLETVQPRKPQGPKMAKTPVLREAVDILRNDVIGPAFPAVRTSENVPRVKDIPLGNGRQQWVMPLWSPALPGAKGYHCDICEVVGNHAEWDCPQRNDAVVITGRGVVKEHRPDVDQWVRAEQAWEHAVGRVVQVPDKPVARTERRVFSLMGMEVEALAREHPDGHRDVTFAMDHPYANPLLINVDDMAHGLTLAQVADTAVKAVMAGMGVR